jgi:hypothetical protein
MAVKRQIAMYVCSAALLLIVAACEREGPAERAGKKIDKAAEELSKPLKKPEGPLEAAGKKLDEAAKETGDAVERATR